MLRWASYLVLVFLTLNGANACESLVNVKATIKYLGSKFVPQELILKNGVKDLIGAYKVTIDGENVPKLCTNMVSGIINLHELRMTNCGIEEIEVGAFKDLPSLFLLDLSHNKIKILPGGVFNGLPVWRVIFSGNGLENIEDGAFENMPKLSYLDLSQNKIRELSKYKDWFNDNNKLKGINLNYNEITEIPEGVFTNMAKQALDLDIWLQHNKISNIHPKAFKDVKKMDTLWIGHNKLTNLDSNLFKGIKIRDLWIHDNKIVCLSDDFLSNLNVEEFDVDWNLLDCDCLQKIYRWAQKNNVKIQTLLIRISCLERKLIMKKEA